MTAARTRSSLPPPQRPSAESVAFLIGSTSVMMLQTLSLAVLFGGFNAAHSHPSWRAFVAFSVLLFMLYVSAALHAHARARRLTAGLPSLPPACLRVCHLSWP